MSWILDRAFRALPASRDHVTREPIRRAIGPYPELDCLRHRIAPGVLAATERRARTLDLGAERVLVDARETTEDSYVVALAAALRLAYEPLDSIARSACPLSDADLFEADKTGLLPLYVGGRPVWVMAPLTHTARRIIALTRHRPEFATHIRLTTARRLRDFVVRHGSETLGRQAAESLRTAAPELSAGARGPPRGLAWLTAAAGTITAALTAPHLLVSVVSGALSLVFLAWTGLRLVGAATSRRRWPHLLISPEELPVYSIIVALYDEAAAAKDLLRALNQLDYPREKLQIILALEPDDHATRAALEGVDSVRPFEIVIAPAGGPRTKPKALNAALSFARGDFIAVFDAEDRPAQDQLYRALEVFFTAGPRTACVQARLTIDNTRDGWLARMFTAEYAGLFDVLLPGLSKRRLPLPLGGSSNHFRAAVLRHVGGWDPYNVTEDADLGMRLARFGFHTAVVDSTTLEEAPATLRHWLPQRTRWFKGWLQTWAVHMREPLRLLRELGWAGFATFQLVVGGTVLASLVHPIFLAVLVHGLLSEGISALAGLYGAMLALGYLTSASLGLAGLARRGLLSQSLILLLTPLHWLLLSAAAWRAVYQLVRDPYRWEKTAHGLARTSRSADEAAANLKIKNNAADRQRPPRAAA